MQNCLLSYSFLLLCLISLPTQQTIYDCIGRLKTATVDKRNGIDVNEVTAYTYNDVGSLKSVEYPNGNYAEYTYDELNRLTKLVNYQDNTKAVTLSSFDYTLAADGMRDSVTESDGTAILWGYDNLNRLIEEDYNAPGTINDYLDKYIYDLVGNRFSKDNGIGITYYFYNDNDQLTKEANDAIGSNIIISYQYNDNGSLTQKVITDGNTYDYTYNLLNRLNSFSDGNITVTYKYDPDGIRVQKDDGTTLADYLIDPFNHTGYSQVFKEKQAGSPDRTFIIGHDILAQSKGAMRRYFLYDGHGSVRQLANGSGSITDTYNYDAYGNALGFAPSTATTNLLYTGEWYDKHTGTYNLRARDYDPPTGRFLTIDTFPGSPQDPISLHKYLYCHANPINRIDPSGLLTTATTKELSVTSCIATALYAISISYVVFYSPADAIIDPIEDRISPSAYRYIQTRQAQVKARKAIRTAEKMAIENNWTGLPDTEIDDLPVFFVFKGLTPYIYKHDKKAIADNPIWVALQYYGPDQAHHDANRRAAIDGKDYLRAKDRPQLDEYPFASTFQGGAGASVAAVPEAEHRIQGSHLNQFYRTKLNYEPKWFLVVPLPLGGP